MKQKEGYRIISWALTGYPDDKPGTDLHVVKKGECISDTPVKVRFLHNTKQLKDLLKTLST